MDASSQTAPRMPSTMVPVITVDLVNAKSVANKRPRDIDELASSLPSSASFSQRFFDGFGSLWRSLAQAFQSQALPPTENEHRAKRARTPQGYPETGSSASMAVWSHQKDAGSGSVFPEATTGPDNTSFDVLPNRTTMAPMLDDLVSPTCDMQYVTVVHDTHAVRDESIASNISHHDPLSVPHSPFLSHSPSVPLPLLLPPLARDTLVDVVPTSTIDSSNHRDGDHPTMHLFESPPIPARIISHLGPAPKPVTQDEVKLEFPSRAMFSVPSCHPQAPPVFIDSLAEPAQLNPTSTLITTGCEPNARDRSPAGAVDTVVSKPKTDTRGSLGPLASTDPPTPPLISRISSHETTSSAAVCERDSVAKLVFLGAHTISLAEDDGQASAEQPLNTSALDIQDVSVQYGPVAPLLPDFPRPASDTFTPHKRGPRTPPSSSSRRTLQQRMKPSRTGRGYSYSPDANSPTSAHSSSSNWEFLPLQGRISDAPRPIKPLAQRIAN